MDIVGVGNFEFLCRAKPTFGIIALITPDGSARQAAGNLAFPNGMVTAPDNKTLIIIEFLHRAVHRV